MLCTRTSGQTHFATAGSPSTSRPALDACSRATSERHDQTLASFAQAVGRRSLDGSSMLTADDFREIALSMHGAIERAHMGHPDFRANGRIFASLHANDLSGTVKLTPEEQRDLMRAHPKVFTPAAGAWGRQGWTVLRLSEADSGTARSAILLAWQNVVDKPRGRQSSKPRDRQAVRPSRRRRT
jgi:hypothetical protein